MPSPSDSPAPEAIQAFIARWRQSGGHERAAAQLFLTELCDLLGLPHADPPSKHNHENRYCFERAVPHIESDGSKSTRFIDCYKRGCFVLETKQGINPDETKEEKERLRLKLDDLQHVSTSQGHGKRGSNAWDTAIEKAKNQAEGYIRDLPPEEGRPPFLIVCDVGHVFELYSEFSLTGGSYVRFPDPKSHRVFLEDLADPEKRELLKTIWTDPLSLDPSKHAAAVTREIADHLAALAKSLESDGHDPKEIAAFLQRCLFTMFAEDVGLLPKDGFLDLLRKVKDEPRGFPVLVTNLWREMATGSEFSTVLLQKIAHFNGGLFENPTALPLTSDQIALLIGATKPDWSNVEPAIFGTLLERALTPQERHKLGAHYTPRSYVERLVKPTIIDPLRQQWETVKADAAQFEEKGKRKEAVNTVRVFHHELCDIKVLDPACGSGNFLYVTLEHMKRLEGEVIELLHTLGDTDTFEFDHYKVRPQQFLGLEINERAVAIAQLVLWIGYFQWHKRATGSADTNDRPLIPKARTIVQQDAVLAYDDWQPRKDADGNYVTIWDGRTTKPHPVTGKEVPDETATKPVLDYINPRRAAWPEADYIVGNPPFLGVRRMIPSLGESYVVALRKAYPSLPDTIDFVVYWWEICASLVSQKKVRRFGLITTNSITQSYSAPVLEKYICNTLDNFHLSFAIPDHPWIDSSDGAAVRIAMTVGAYGNEPGTLQTVVSESDNKSRQEKHVDLEPQSGCIGPRLTVGARLSEALPLSANHNICFQGVVPAGEGFKVDTADPIFDSKILKPYLIGRDLVQRPVPRFIIDLFGYTESEMTDQFPRAYQRLRDEVYPERLQNRRHSYREKWWLFAEPRPAMRKALADLERFIGTPYTSKFRPFVFIEADTIPDAMVYAIATDDAFHLGCLSSITHTVWAAKSGGKMGVGNDSRYTSKNTFLPFPFPHPDESELTIRIRNLGERLDAHRKARQAEHADLTLTGMYNVLEKLRKEEPLTEKDRKIHELSLITLLKSFHDQIDAAVLEAYGWTDLVTSTPLADRLSRGDEDLEQQILTRLVDLNHQRAAEEKRGLIRYLRPEYQNPNYQAETKHAEQSDLAIQTPAATSAAKAKLSWPKTTREQIAILKQLLPSAGPNAAALSAHFGRKAPARESQIQDLLHTLADLGQL